MLRFLVGYLLGTIPSADIAARSAGAGDLRVAGSGNPGAANAMAVLGTKWGMAVMAADIGKGAAASAVGGHVGAVGAVVGHCFPVWNGFQGGKGVACGVGQCAVTFPAWFPIELAVAGATGASPRWKQRAYAATAITSVAWVGAGLLWWRKQLPNLWGPTPTAALPAAAAASSAVILYRFATSKPLTADQHVVT